MGVMVRNPVIAACVGGVLLLCIQQVFLELTVSEPLCLDQVGQHLNRCVLSGSQAHVLVVKVTLR